MRIFLLTALLASVAVPAIAATPEDDRRAARAEARSERAERAERPARTERPARAERAVRSDRSDRRERIERAVRAAPQGDVAVARDRVRPGLVQRINRDAPDSVRDWRANERRRAETPAIVQRENGLRERSARERRRVTDADVTRDPREVVRRDRRIIRTPVAGARPPAVSESARRASARRWSDDHRRRWRDSWRRDNRYGWYDWRRRNHSLFRLGVYYDPFGWGYQRFGIGSHLWPSHYSSRYWLNDPWQYRLPHAPVGYRWVRYWDDAVLVDTWTGEVVDVINNFFW